MKPRRAFLTRLAAGATLAALAATASLGGDWRQFRGPRGAGLADETNAPVISYGPKSIAWKVPLPGRGLASPIIVGDRVFLTCSSGPQQDRLHIICLNAADGSKRWERQFWATGRTSTHEKICVAVPTPTSDGQRLFAAFTSDDVFCLDLDGNLIWFRALMRDYPNAGNTLGLASSPVVADGVLVMQVETDGDAFVAGLDVATGINRWKLERRKRANWSSPVTLSGVNGTTVVALQSSAGVCAIDPATGQQVWNYPDGASTVPSSTSRGSILFVPSFGITALQTSPDAQPPKQLWRSNQYRPATASPIALDDHIFAVNDAGVLSCGDAATGARLWQLRLKGPFTSSPVALGKQLYLVNEKGLAQIVDATKPEGEVVSELDLGETVLGTPSVANGAVYFRSDGHIWKLASP